MDGYDEDLTTNQFFLQFRNRCPTIFATLPEKKWVLCVPRAGSFDETYFSDLSFFSHVLVLLESEDGQHTQVKTLRNQRLTIQNKVITTGSGFRRLRKVPILFDETFFDEAGQSHVVYCLAEPLEKARNPEEFDSDESPSSDEEEEEHVSAQSLLDGLLAPLNSVEECKLLLWGYADRSDLQSLMDTQLEPLLRDLRLLAESDRPNFDLDACLADLQACFERCLGLARKDAFLAHLIETNPALLDSVTMATESYLLHCAWTFLEPLLCELCLAKDAALNAQVRRLCRTLSSSAGVPRDFLDRIPRARRELAHLERATTPRAKNLCLRKLTRLLASTAPMENNEEGRRPSVLTSDELLPILAFLIVKSNTRNWHAQLNFMRYFRLGPLTDAGDEFSFSCATLEAALELVLSGLGLSESVHLETSTLTTRIIRTDSGTTPRSVEAFLKLVDKGDTQAVAALLARPNPESASLALRQCHPLCRCAECERAQVERSRLAGVHCYNDQGRTALHIAALRGHTELVDLLIAHDAPVNVVDGNGWTGLHLACLHGHQDTVLLLLEAKVDINAPDNEGNSALHLCTERNFSTCVKALLYWRHDSKSVLNIDAVNMDGETALHLASRYGYEDLVELLLDSGATAGVKNRRGALPIQLALAPSVRYRFTSSVRRPPSAAGMTESGIDIPTPVCTAPTPAPTPTRAPPATASRSTSRSSGFIDGSIHGPTNDLESSTQRRVEKMLKAAGDGDLPMVRHFLGLQDDDDEEEDEEEEEEEEGEDVMEMEQVEKRRSITTLCHPLCQCERCLPIQKLALSTASSEVNINSSNSDGFTPLHVAALHGHAPLAKFLLTRGADPNRRTKNCRLAPLHLAAQHGRPALVSLLCDFGADVDAQESGGNAPLHYAAARGHLSCVDRLLEAGARLALSNGRGNGALHEASRGGHAGVVRTLLARGARAAARNRQQLTPLQFATAPEVRRLLTSGSKEAGGAAGRAHGPAWSGDRGSMPPNHLSLLTGEEDEELWRNLVRQKVELAEEVLEHRPLFEEDSAPILPPMDLPGIGDSTESSPYRSAIVESLASTTPENAYRLDFNSLESSPETRGRRVEGAGKVAEEGSIQ